MKKKIKDLTYDELQSFCYSIPQDSYDTRVCIGCPFWKFRSEECTCDWIFDLWDDLKEFLEMLDQEIEVEE